MWPAILAAAAPVVGGLIGAYGQERTNASNEAIANNATAANMQDAQANRQFQASQANTQMQFQERMANTVHQREAEDLKKAGLNPILAANGGAPAPSGAAGSGAQGSAASATMQNPLAGLQGLMSSALEAATLLGGLDKQVAETNLIKANTYKSGIEAESTKKNIPQSELINDLYDIIRPAVKKSKQFLQSNTVKGFVKKGIDASQKTIQMRNP